MKINFLIKFLIVNLMFLFLVTGCGDNDTNNNKNIVDDDLTEANVENSIANVNDIDSSTSKGDTIDVDPVFYDTNGEEVRLSEFSGKPIVLNFWTSWCVPCQYELADFQKIYEKYGDDVEFVMIDLVGVQGETEEMGMETVVSNNYTFPIYFDTSGEVLFSLVITEMPTTIFINSDGTILWKEEGLIGYDALDEKTNELIQNNNSN